MASRLSKWLEANKGISWSQRAIFNRNGVRDNSFLINSALQSKKSVMFFDLSDAFNSVSHQILSKGLRDSGCPLWVVRLIQNLYNGCSSLPVTVEKKPLCDPIPIKRGVKQGCPMSSVLFNFYINPIIEAAADAGGTCLGYMDDLAIILPDANYAQAVVDNITKTASSLHMTFNIKKCGVMNVNHDVFMNMEPIPATPNYKYLGAWANNEKLVGLNDAFNLVKADCDLILNSDLTPMQKLHAVRTHVLPKLYHLIQNTSPLQSHLKKINAYMRKVVKIICFLPEKATSSYCHLSRIHGGPGIPDVVWLRRTNIITSLIACMNQEPEFTEIAREILGFENLHAIVDKINSGERAGLHPVLKEVSSALKAFSSENEAEYQLKANDRNHLILTKDGKFIPFYSTHLKAVSNMLPLRQLLKCKNQGRFFETLQHSPAATRAIYNFHTKMCDWRFAHKARLNLSPLKGSITWTDQINKNCRRCQLGDETLNHVLNSCPAQKKEIVGRHNKVRDHIEKWIPDHVTFFSEQRFGDCQPDFVIETDTQYIITDVKISNENPSLWNRIHSNNATKYEKLKNYFANRGKPTSVETLQFGCLGSASMSCAKTLKKIMQSQRKTNATLRAISNILVHQARNQTVTHLTGKHQNE